MIGYVLENDMIVRGAVCPPGAGAHDLPTSNQIRAVQSKVYTTVSSIKTICAWGITYIPCPWAMEGCVHPEAVSNHNELSLKFTQPPLPLKAYKLNPDPETRGGCVYPKGNYVIFGLLLNKWLSQNVHRIPIWAK